MLSLRSLLFQECPQALHRANLLVVGQHIKQFHSFANISRILHAHFLAFCSGFFVLHSFTIASAGFLPLCASHLSPFRLARISRIALASSRCSFCVLPLRLFSGMVGEGFQEERPLKPRNIFSTLPNKTSTRSRTIFPLIAEHFFHSCRTFLPLLEKTTQ